MDTDQEIDTVTTSITLKRFATLDEHDLKTMADRKTPKTQT